ncbi:MAG: hypothetical protein ACYTGL_00170 [Planctomycetota bacterium]|jgi:hypothetical protein
MTRRLVCGAAAAAVVISSSVAALAAGPLDLVPASAGVVVRLKNPNATIANIGNFANQVQPGLGFMVQGQASALGILISNPTLAGVDLKQDWHIAVFPVVNAEPAVVFIVPTTDAAALEAAVGDGFTFTSKDTWAAYSQDEAVIELVEELADGTGESVAMDRRAAGVFDSGDISVYVNTTSLTETYKDKLAEADEQLDLFLEGLKAQVAGQQPGMDLGPIFDVYGDMARGLLQAVRDSESFSVGVGVTAEAITIEELLLVEADSGTDSALQVHKPGDLAILNRLPQDKLGYMALQMDLQTLMKWGLNLASKFAEGTKNSDDENVKKIAEMIEKFSGMADKLEGIELGSAAWAFGLKDTDSAILEGYAISEANPAEKMREVTRSMTGLGQIELPGVKQEITVEAAAEKYGDLTADIVRVKQEYSEEADPLGIQKEMQKLMYGEDGMVQRIVIKDNHVIQTIGGTQDDMKTLLAAFDASASAPTTLSAVQKARQGLLEQANFVALIDLPSLAVKGLSVASKTGQLPIPVNLEGVDQVKVQPSFVGFSIGTEPQGVRMKTQISSATGRGIMAIVAFFQRQMQQPNQNPGF